MGKRAKDEPTLEQRVAALEAAQHVLEAAARKYLKMLRQARGGDNDE